jgi:hypothetical protein
VRLQPKVGRARGKSPPPHSMSGGAVDENFRCKRQYPKELRQIHPLLKCLSYGAVDTGAMSDPLTLVPTVHRIEHVNANAYIPGSYERPAVGITGWPTVHRLLRTREPASRRHGENRLTTRRPLPPIGGPKRQKHAYFSGILTPSAISRVWRKGVWQAEYAIQVMFFGLPPMSCLGGRG